MASGESPGSLDGVCSMEVRLQSRVRGDQREWFVCETRDSRTSFYQARSARQGLLSRGYLEPGLRAVGIGEHTLREEPRRRRESSGSQRRKVRSPPGGR